MAKKYSKLSGVLKKLLFERGMKPIQLARELNLPQPTVHRLVTGKCTRPYQSSIEPIADYFNITIDQLTGESPLPGEQSQEIRKATLGTQAKVIPLFSWETAGQKNKTPESELVAGNVSADAFAVNMPDYSMEPLFQKNALLIFDPTIVPTDRSYILVKLHTSNNIIFRQLLVDADQKFIKSLNPDISAASMRLLSPEDKILGCLVETRNSFQSKTL